MLHLPSRPLASVVGSWLRCHSLSAAGIEQSTGWHKLSSSQFLAGAVMLVSPSRLHTLGGAYRVGFVLPVAVRC